jgi:hypothetical protein
MAMAMAMLDTKPDFLEMEVERPAVCIHGSA